jgi:biotin synthesis protein BioG
MKRKWLNKENNKSCILFFNGWGMDENTVCHLDSNSFDICMFNDYNPVSEIDENFNKYENIYLIAWSLGVWASAKVLYQTEIKITKAIALNGTQNPIDINKGIPPVVFNATLNGWNEKSRNKFNMRILGGRKQYTQFNESLSTRDIENQKDELSYILNEVSQNKTHEIKFDCALVGSQDLIFSSNNQLNYWNAKTRIVKAEAPHFPFAGFKSWNEIIKL